MSNYDNAGGSSVLGTEIEPGYKPTSDERLWAILSHILNIPFPFFAALIIYLIKKDDSKYVADHAKESLNFQITLIVCALISIILVLVLIGILLLWLLGIIGVVLVVVATVKAFDDKLYRYPFNLRLIR